MSVPEPKVEHHAGRGIRSCPIFPELRPFLEKAWDLAPEGAEFVIDKPAYRAAADTGEGWKNSNLRTQFLKKLAKAGIVPWGRLFQSMRASRQTELERQFPLHVVCSWLGNTEAIARKNYLLVTDSDFEKACTPKPPVQSDAYSDAVEPKSDAYSDAASSRTNPQEKEKTPENTGEIEVSLEFSEVSRWRRGELNNQ